MEKGLKSVTGVEIHCGEAHRTPSWRRAVLQDSRLWRLPVKIDKVLSGSVLLLKKRTQS